MWRLFGAVAAYRRVYSWGPSPMKGRIVFSRLARLVAVSLPVILVGVLVFAGGWRIHDGRVERVSQTSASVAGPVEVPVGVPEQSAEPTTQVAFVHHLSPSIPWPVWVALMVLCILPAVASIVAWSSSRPSRDATYSA
jgi:hypothetical protein